jgi:membrane associated rhomboid family serine protease
MLSITLILVIMTSLISYQAFNDANLRSKLVFHPASVQEFGQWYRFLSSGFIHADWGHLLINMFVLYQFGEVLEHYFAGPIFDPLTGRLVFLFFYLSAIVAAGIPSYFKHRDNYGYAALGASGATSAMVMAYVLFNPWGWFLFPPLPGVLLAAAYLWYSSYMAKHGSDNIAHDAHLWGAVYGIAFMLVVAAVYKPGLLGLFVALLLEGPSWPY